MVKRSQRRRWTRCAQLDKYSILDICRKIAVNIENDPEPSVRKLTFNLRGR
jgi:hypothetical protein